MRLGGRQKGTPNKRTLDVQAMADELGIDPVKFLLLVVKGDLREFGYVFPEDEVVDQELVDELDEEEKEANLYFDKKMVAFLPKHLIPLDTRIQAAKEVAGYVHAKRKSIEVSTDDETKKVFGFIAQDEFNKAKGDS